MFFVLDMSLWTHIIIIISNMSLTLIHRQCIFSASVLSFPEARGCFILLPWRRLLQGFIILTVCAEQEDCGRLQAPPYLSNYSSGPWGGDKNSQRQQFYQSFHLFIPPFTKIILNLNLLSSCFLRT